MRKFFLGTTVLSVAAVILAVSTPKARADLVVDYSLDGGATFLTLLSGASGSTLNGGSATLGVALEAVSKLGGGGLESARVHRI
jgi:hypothetical protein